MNIKEISSQLVNKLQKYNDFQGLYVYGSHVNGQPLPHSDIDIVAVFDKQLDYKKKFELHSLALDVELNHDVILDFHPMTLDELNLNYVFFNEVKKGIYYAAG